MDTVKANKAFVDKSGETFAKDEILVVTDYMTKEAAPLFVPGELIQIAVTKNGKKIELDPLDVTITPEVKPMTVEAVVEP